MSCYAIFDILIDYVLSFIFYTSLQNIREILNRFSFDKS